MYMVQPKFNSDSSRRVDVVHIDSLVRAAHLIPHFGTGHVPEEMHCYDSYDSYDSFYLNRFVDHHAFEIA
ncbi:hypothetical protein CONPUDRAFT_65748 [Coniophora puteana RWD-64-598 SS2]|uniref:Uncharacterized protein n=1 Tax=Coniophora puteana (strain RWD-64-598) TaxID=741705 RepID=A0A5M3M8T1_CONPW|nr:uncharacterized protein CONPUDRAFT_65748 [Coniophora puteana RWD-64-598 SS2]EIW75493.1 hypothetical protein CONPUDRAFT_65748 [Coniophora puteana RWD-64-598 SS2]